eukprot:TRINITY_DN60888_c0_g1_i1.p1 TRINITY_DN60888_c0_g1~~TRINITY_DN60888_c0_g1_i1.p1  ORF type:complete len:260 (+),score=68.42 TRINITY_DN60888_c0_g1_i1:116-895(+)
MEGAYCASLESKELEQEFLEAVKHVGTSPGLALPGTVQRRLFGLYARVKHGVSTPQPAPGQHEEQWRAWDETRELSETAAMQEYIDLVSKHDPDWLLSDGQEDQEMPGSELPPDIKEQLARAGLKEAASCGNSSRTPSDVFTAARTGASLANFIPAQQNAKDEDGLTPLIHAVDAEMADAVAELLLAGANPDLADPQRATPLHYAAILGSRNLVEQLLAGGADPRKADEDGASPADVARAEGHADLAEMLAEATAKFHG